MSRAALAGAACAIVVGLAACTEGDHGAAAADAGVARDAALARDAAPPGRTDASGGDAGARDASLADATDACGGGSAGADAGAVCVARVEGRAVDESGAPVPAGTLVSACGPTECSPGQTERNGHFVIPVAQRIVTDRYSVLVHLRPDHAAFYQALPAGAAGPVIDVGTLTVLAMPASGPALTVDRAGAPAQSLTSGDVTLEVGQGVSVRLDVESNLAGAPGKELRARRVPDALLEQFSGRAAGIRAMYALEPFESSFELPGSPPVPTSVRLSFANAAMLPPGSAVEVLALGTYVFPAWLEPATFQPVARGHVSADGARVDLDAGEGVLHLTWVALRPVP